MNDTPWLVFITRAHGPMSKSRPSDVPLPTRTEVVHRPRTNLAGFVAEKEMLMFRTQFLVLREAIDVVLRHLEALPPTDLTEQLRTRVQDCAQDAEMWSAAWPTPREMDVLMKRVLALHVQVTKVERSAALADGAAVTECSP